MLRTYTDTKLLELLNTGSEKAFNEIFRRYSPLVFQVAFGKLRSKEQAEEIVQDIFITIWNKRGGIQISNFSHYLKAATKYKVIDSIRSKINQEKYWDYYKSFIPQFENTTEDKSMFDNLMGSIEEKMETLPEKTRAIFYMNRFDGCSVREISHKLSISEKAIEYHLTKSVKTLKLFLRNYVL